MNSKIKPKRSILELLFVINNYTLYTFLTFFAAILFFGFLQVIGISQTSPLFKSLTLLVVIFGPSIYPLRKFISRALISLGVSESLFKPFKYIKKITDKLIINPLKVLDYKLRLAELKTLGPKYEYFKSLENSKKSNDHSDGLLSRMKVSSYRFEAFWIVWSYILLLFAALIMFFGIFFGIISGAFISGDFNGIPYTIGVILFLGLIGIVFVFCSYQVWRGRAEKCTNLQCSAVRATHQCNSNEDLGLLYSYQKQTVDKHGDKYIHTYEVRNIQYSFTCCECNKIFTVNKKETITV